jgi:hypothetical protein
MIDFFENLISQWNEEEQCGLCWRFFGAGRSDYSNLITHDSCCVAVVLENFGSRYGYTRNQYDINTKEYCEEWFDLIVGVPSSLDLSFYNEISDDFKDTSKYKQYIQPIIDCIGCGIDIECNQEGYEVMEWSWSLVLNYQDYNLDGIRIKGRLRKYLN